MHEIIFIADLHLSDRSTSKNLLFLQKLQQWAVQKIIALYILGDLFDYWLGDDDITDFNLMIQRALYEFSHQTPIYMIRGNHDFALGEKFAQNTNVRFLPDMSVIELLYQDKLLRIIMSHGDKFCIADISYQRLKFIMQQPVIMWCLLHMPLSWRYHLKDILSHKSNKPKDPAIMAISTEAIDTACKKYEATVVIHGHTHQPGVNYTYSHNRAIYRYVIPDWHNSPPGGFLTFNQNRGFEICYGS